MVHVQGQTTHWMINGGSYLQNWPEFSSVFRYLTAQWFKTEGRGGEMDEIVAPCWICLPLKRLGLSPKSPPKMTYSACYGAWLPWLVAILLALQPFKVKEISVKWENRSSIDMYYQCKKIFKISRLMWNSVQFWRSDPSYFKFSALFLFWKSMFVNHPNVGPTFNICHLYHAWRGDQFGDWIFGYRWHLWSYSDQSTCI